MGSTHRTSPINTSITGRMRRRARSAPMVALAAALALAGCAGDDDAATPDASGALADDALEAPAATIRAASEQPTGTEPGRDSGVAGDDIGFEFGSIGRDVIVELHVQMESDDIARSVAAVTADAVTLGGGVASSDISYGTEDRDGETNGDGYAVIVVKVPPDAVARLLGNLDATGRVTSVNQSAQDVTEQLIDLDVRITNARESVANVRRFMEQANNLTDLVSLEGELTRRQTELEQLEAQQRNLSERVALSTVTIEIRPAALGGSSDVADDADDSIGDAFRTGWEAFAGVLFGLAFVLAVAAPFVVAGLVVLGLAWLVVRLASRPSGPVERTSADDDRFTSV